MVESFVDIAKLAQSVAFQDVSRDIQSRVDSAVTPFFSNSSRIATQSG